MTDETDTTEGHELDDPAAPAEGGPVDYPPGPQDDEATED